MSEWTSSKDSRLEHDMLINFALPYVFRHNRTVDTESPMTTSLLFTSVAATPSPLR